ncbi:MAG: UDP-N-acetylmuramate--L-alanine ligase [Roseburia sp.]|nr:UDP-N-acetylmuramate--L-alanine ligase [Roseburia sp.]
MYTLDFSQPGSLYFAGIGGVSMSGLAEVLAEAGFRVSGSDRARSPVCEALKQKGITVFYGQRSENITDDIDCMIFTSAIREDNPEFIAARKKNLPTLTRGQLMGQLMKRYGMPIGISGTHGKTTTTSMISEILLKAEMDPTVFVGGMLKSIGGNLRIGRSDFFVTEACEYTNSFLSFCPRVGIILNIEEDHLDFFKDLADIRHSFKEYAGLLPADGCLIINGDIERLEEITENLACRVITFSVSCSGDYTPDDITYDQWGHPSFTLRSPGKPPRRFTLKVPGLHNIGNALAAIALADFLGIDNAFISAALEAFSGTDRRFEYKGSIGGVTVIDDYAHHPSEIRATLTAAGEMPHHTLWCVFQPHTYTRTKAFLEDFAQALCLADRIVLTDIYAARETDTLGISSATLQEKIKALGKECDYFPTFDEVENFLLENCTNNDMLITMGAGDVYKIGENLLGR